MDVYDFSGWATKANVKCTDGRTILSDAFKNDHGRQVPLVWNHQHNDPENVLGHAVLEHRAEGVYAYCTFNNTPKGQHVKEMVKHGDVTALSIYANKLKQNGFDVQHGVIRELSLVLAGANPEAFIETVISHSEYGDEEAIIFTGDVDDIDLYHSEEYEEVAEEDVETDNEVVNEEIESTNDVDSETTNDVNTVDNLEHSDEDDETLLDVFETFTDKQKIVVYELLSQALESAGKSEDKNEQEGADKTMKHNLFEKDGNQTTVLSHADQAEIITMAKSSRFGTLQSAIEEYKANNSESLQHGIDDIETLFPNYKDVKPGAPELITNDQTWVNAVMNGVHKSPISRIRTRQADARGADLRASGHKKGDEKKLAGNIKLLSRTTDPQTVYRKDALHRDDILDIEDFDVVEYQYGVMKMNLNEEVATAILIGDGREDGDADRISPEHIRPIWQDDELYTIHAVVDMEATKAKIQGTNSVANFGDEYLYTEAIIAQSLYATEQYKGSGSMVFFCTPHTLNVMLLARDLNGRRIYSSQADLAAALNVKSIITVEQFQGKTRTVTVDGKSETRKLLGLFVNLKDYHVGAVKGGELTRFEQFDIDFNQQKYLIETRLSGALTKIKSAIALEETVTA